MTFSSRKFARQMAVVVLCGLGCATSSQAADAKTSPPPTQDKMIIRLGALLDLQGASTTPLFRSSVDLAARQMNEALARAGSPLRFDIVLGETRSVPAEAQAEALRLIEQEHVKALVSDNSGDTIAVNKLNYDPANPARPKLAITCFQCSSSAIHDANAVETDPVTQAAERDAEHWVFRVFYDAKYEAAVIDQVALGKIKATRPNSDAPIKIAVFADNGHRSIAQLIPETLPKLTSSPASAEVFYVSTLDKIAGDWSKVLAGKPDVVIVAMLPAGATEAIKTYRQAGYTTPIVSNNSFRRDYILKGIGNAADGLEGSSVTLVDKSRSGQAFVQAFKKLTGESPEVTGSGAYDSAVTLMLAAITASGDIAHPREATPADIRQALGKINDPHGQIIRPTVSDFAAAVGALGHGKPINYEGAYNSLDWNSANDIFPPLVHWKVEKGRFVEYELYDCTPQKPLCPVK